MTNSGDQPTDPIAEIRQAATLLGIELSGSTGSHAAGSAISEPAKAEKLRLGGMALANGLLVHGPTHWAAAVRAPDGSIAVASGRKWRLNLADRVPGLRGIVRLGEAAAVTIRVKRALPQARMPFQNRSALGVAVLAAAAGSRLRRREHQTALVELVGAVVSLAPAVAALRGGELASYHGVEHKAIAAYEQDAPDAAQAAKEHDRCGSHLITPMLACNLAGSALVRRLGPRAPTWAPAAVSLASIGLAVEVFGWSERHAASRPARLLRRPGHELQRVLGTREPDEDQLDVGRAALREILRVEAAPAR